jgi:uncharacterized phage protein (TIGR02218 family)
MKTASAFVRNLLGSSQFRMADCYTFTLQDGTQLRYTSADRDVAVQEDWLVVSADNFLRADSAPGAVGDGWIDVHGGVWRIASDRLQSTADGIDGDTWKRDFLLRPSTENQRDQRIVATLGGGNNYYWPNYAAFWTVHRYNPVAGGGAAYAILFYPGDAIVQAFAISGATGAQIGPTVTLSAPFDPTHAYSLDSRVTGASPTAIQATVTDTTAGAVVAELTVNDSSVGLQGAGQYGLTANSPGSHSVQTLYGAIATYRPGPPTVFSSAGPYFERSKVKFQLGVQVDELDLVVTAKPTDLLDGAPWFSALRAGILDGAELQLDRAFLPAFGSDPGDGSAGLVTLFAGRVAEVDVGRSQATIKVNTHLELLSLQWPWRLFQPGCARTLYDAGCGVNKADHAVSAIVGSGSTTRDIVTNLAQGAGWASLGMMVFTSGALAGKTYGVRLDDGAGNLQPSVPVPIPPAPGDAVTIYPGCDRQQATCKNKFANLQRFEGFPYVPVPETAV